MPQVIFAGWQSGLQKISLAHLLHEKADLGGRAAKECVDLLLADEGFAVEVSTVEQAHDLALHASKLGAVCHVKLD